MTHMLKRKHQNDLNTSSSSSTHPPPLHRDSRVIAKVQPKIRIIHIFAPEIIQTDVANFRELVQRLTGKPSPSSTTTTTTSTSSGLSMDKNTSSDSIMEPTYNNNSDNNNNYQYKPVIDVNNKVGFGGYEDHRDHNGSGGFLGVFDEMKDYFMEMGEYAIAPNEMNLQAQHQHLDHHLYEDTFHPLSYRG